MAASIEALRAFAAEAARLVEERADLLRQLEEAVGARDQAVDLLGRAQVSERQYREAHTHAQTLRSEAEARAALLEAAGAAAVDNLEDLIEIVCDAAGTDPSGGDLSRQKAIDAARWMAAELDRARAEGAELRQTVADLRGEVEVERWLSDKTRGLLGLAPDAAAGEALGLLSQRLSLAESQERAATAALLYAALRAALHRALALGGAPCDYTDAQLVLRVRAAS